MASRASVTTILASVETSERAARTFCSNAAPPQAWDELAQLGTAVGRCEQHDSSLLRATPLSQQRPKSRTFGYREGNLL